ncbi:MAG: hypothetical protein Q7W55_08410 [Pseudohongiella sp.]|nr:hypothetical protein [Pseudohongiella sp.]MDO9519890.1 hypothetical protein [Pseudohongiella sp.]MDP2126821.1 hypothetical protein [Pseudohongiella sp.]
MAANKPDLRVLLIHSAGAELYFWHKRTLLFSNSFRSDESGFERFYGELSRDSNTAFFLLADCIEEDFKHESVAHVRGTDRTALLSRKLEFLFRSTPYRTATITGREKSGRRDDNALFSALTKPELLAPWVDRILDARIAIKGISTPAYLLQQFVHQQKIIADHQIIVNIETNSGIRQTYLSKGKVMFSRLSPRLNEKTGITAEQLKDQVVQTRKYLERIKLVPYDKSVDVTIFTSAEEFDSLIDSTTDLLTYSLINTLELSARAKIDRSIQDKDSALLLILAQDLRKGKLSNVYAPFKTRRYFHLHQARVGLFAAAFGLVLSGTVYSMPLVLRAIDQFERTDLMRQQTQPLLSQYEQLREGFPETPIPSNTMAVVVEAYDAVQRQISNPSDIMLAVSRALEETTGIRLAEFLWSVDMNDQAREAALIAQLSGLPTSNDVQFINAVINEQTALSVRIRGFVDNTTSYQVAQSEVLSLMRAIESESGMKVTPLTMPLDDSTVGSVTTTLDGNTLRAPFVLELTAADSP